MIDIHEKFWVPMASLNFFGSASVWLQSVQRKLTEFDWESFSNLLCTRFGDDGHQLLICKFYSLSQKTTIADYIEKFELIISHLSAYSESIHPYYYLTRFFEGLRPDIRAVVLVQRPLTSTPRALWRYFRRKWRMALHGSVRILTPCISPSRIGVTATAQAC